jgi:hypothetical protein
MECEINEWMNEKWVSCHHNMTYRSNGPDKEGSCEYIGQAVVDNQ